jgi:hypothetical protein
MTNRKLVLREELQLASIGWWYGSAWLVSGRTKVLRRHLLRRRRRRRMKWKLLAAAAVAPRSSNVGSGSSTISIIGTAGIAIH